MHALKKYTWQEELSNIITDPAELLRQLALDTSLLEAAYAAVRLFPLKVTRSYLARMRVGDVNDPLLRQVLPLGAELTESSQYGLDPLGEAKVNPIAGLLHKYHGRVLVTLTSACAIHCRYCFRRHFPYSENNPGREGWEKIFAYVANDMSLREVILSGGDPLAVSDGMLQAFTDRLAMIPHVDTLRIHSRLPIVLPQRVTSELLTWIRGIKQSVVIVVHANHPQEINTEVRDALLSLRDAGAHVLNQAVLLQGVNDNVATLVALSEILFAAGTLPYYLHVLDKVKGAAHFDLPIESARDLHAELTRRLPGYLVPRLVREDAGQASKTLL